MFVNFGRARESVTLSSRKEKVKWILAEGKMSFCNLSSKFS